MQNKWPLLVATMDQMHSEDYEVLSYCLRTDSLKDAPDDLAKIQGEAEAMWRALGIPI